MATPGTAGTPEEPVLRVQRLGEPGSPVFRAKELCQPLPGRPLKHAGLEQHAPNLLVCPPAVSPRSERGVPLVVEQNHPGVGKDLPLATEAGPEQVANELIVFVERAGGMVDLGVDLEQPGDEEPVSHADLGQVAPLLPAPLPGVRPVAVTEVVLVECR